MRCSVFTGAAIFHRKLSRTTVRLRVAAQRGPISLLFGPIFTVTHVVWLVVGTIVGLALAPFTDQSWKDDVCDVA